MVNTEIFLGSGASLTFIPEVDYHIKPASMDSGKTTITLSTNHTNDYDLVTNLYTGCTIDYYDAGSYSSTHTIKSNTATTITVSPAVPSGESSGNYLDASADWFIIRGYAMPTPSSSGSSNLKRLSADNWLGLVESATFPSVEQEMKQMNLQLGGSRNFTHQYKGIRTSSGGSINLVANHGTWLYYALGQCTNIACTFTGQAPANMFSAHDSNGNVYLDTGDAGGGSSATSSTFLSTGPIFYRTASNGETSGTVNNTNHLTPTVLRGFDTFEELELLTRTTSTESALTAPITYTFTELNTGELPSFSLEQSLAKDPSTLTTEVGSASESQTFVRIARGNRVNTLTMTANENEEVKMTMDLNTAAVNKLPQSEKYEARAGVTTHTNLFNYPPSGSEALLEPFFFSDGSFNIFGQEFMKITNFTLTINNNLQDKRFVGVGTRDMKVGIPAQRNYEISFTALITDDLLFEELFNETESTSTSDVSDGSSNGVIQLIFEKDNGEKITLKFKNYFLNSSNVTIPDDKGPITVEGTVMPRDLHLCEVHTHWVLQG